MYGAGRYTGEIAPAPSGLRVYTIRLTLNSRLAYGRPTDRPTERRTGRPKDGRTVHCEKVVLGDLNLLFRGQQFELLISHKR